MLEMPAKILIVEDEPLLAMAMCEQLSEAGFEIAGVAPTLAKAMTLLDQVECGAAILDCQLRGESVEPLAVSLSERSIPFLFYSGGTGGDVLERFRASPLVSKPASTVALITALKALLG
jgi:DNA-binding response OmpR family regulator